MKAATVTEPRLVDLKAACAKYGFRLWSLRRLIWNGAIPVVRLPSLDGREGKAMRRILIDCADLDRLIDQCKERVGADQDDDKTGETAGKRARRTRAREPKVPSR